MSLKELTKNSHTAAENTKFMKAVFKGKMTPLVWSNFLYQKSLFYNAIESCAGDLGLLDGIGDIRRSFLLLNDFKEMNLIKYPKYNYVSIDYYQYIINLHPDPKKIMAHLYTWHMGDLHGGQMIKKVVNAPSSHLDFKNRDELIQIMRSRISDDLADEATVAFNWAIRIMDQYATELDI